MGTTRRVLPASLLALLAVPLAAVAAGTGHSGWNWSTPTPQGHDLTDVAFSGDTGYAVGAFGTMLRSTDGGATWTGLASGTTARLAGVRQVSPLVAISGGECVVRRTDDGATVTRVVFGGPELNCLTSVVTTAFADAANGFILLSDGTVLATADGGRTYARRTPLPGSPATSGLAQIGDLVAVSPTTLLAGAAARVFRSTDGGNSWTPVSPENIPTPSNPIPQVIRSITMATPTTGFAVGDAGRVLTTVDGGASWTPLAAPGSMNLARVRCASATVCLIATDGATLVRTPDGGASWSQVTPSGARLRGVAFASATRAVAVGDGGATVISDDAGVTWRPVGAGAEGVLTAVGASAKGGLFAWGDRGLLVTSRDAGATWVAGSVPTSAPIRSARYVTPDVGYAIDGAAGVWKTDNRGVTWQVLDPGPDPQRLTDLLALDPARVLLVGPGDIRVSRDGQTFDRVVEPVVTRARDLRWIFRSRKGAVAAGRTRLLYSANARTAWKGLPRPVARGRAVTIDQISCTAGGACWALGTNDRLYLTANLGRRWKDVSASLPGNALRQAVALAFSTDRRGYVLIGATGFDPLVQGGWVLRTTDGGATWAPQLVAQPVLVAGATGAPADVLLGGANALFTSTSGGAQGTPTVLGLTPSRKTFKRRATVTFTGRLRPALGGERVVVSASGFAPRSVTVSSGGTFSLSYRVTRTTTFVAHWGGDGIRQGDGSPVITVTRR